MAPITAPITGAVGPELEALEADEALHELVSDAVDVAEHVAYINAGVGPPKTESSA